jgi:hypothetical protein
MFMAKSGVFPGCDLMGSAKRCVARLAIPMALFASLFHILPCCRAQAAEPQLEIAKVEEMPRVPEPLHLIDWKKTAREYYTVLFNPELKGLGLPAVNLSTDRKHFGFGSYLVAQRQRDPSGEAHACLIPVVGANMLGLDMAHLFDVNWIDPTLEWFDPRTRIWANRPHSGNKIAHVIYEYWPLVIGTLLADAFPKHEELNAALIQQADTLVQMGRDLGYPGQLDLDQDYQYRDGRWIVLPRRIDSNVGNAGSFAWALYAAYTRNPRPEYLALAKESIGWWLTHPGRYEMSHEMGPLVLARLNAEHECDFDMQRMLNIWFGDYKAFTPPLAEGQVMPWGIVAGSRLGGVTCDGLDGACWRGKRDGGFYAFAMGSYQAPGWLLPAVRYDQRIARAAGRYALNAANSCRYFLGVDLDWDHQDHKDWRDSLADGTGYLFSYEGVRSQPHAGDPQHMFQPYATGDHVIGQYRRNQTPLGQYWIEKRELSKSADNIALYMGASIGFLGAPYNATDVDGIIAWDLNVTDHFAPPSFPTRLLYNPFDVPRAVTLDVGQPMSDLYDTVAGQFILRNVRGRQTIMLAADQAAVIVIAPANLKRELVGRRLRLNGITIDYRANPLTP